MCFFKPHSLNIHTYKETFYKKKTFLSSDDPQTDIFTNILNYILLQSHFEVVESKMDPVQT